MRAARSSRGLRVEGPYEATNVGAEFKGVRSGVERRRGVCVGIETEGPLMGGETRRVRNSLRDRVHHADAVVWGPV